MTRPIPGGACSSFLKPRSDWLLAERTSNCIDHQARLAYSTLLGSPSHLPCLIIRLIIQTIRWDPSGSDQIDDPSNLSRPDPSGADQIDAEHQATDLVGFWRQRSRQAI